MSESCEILVTQWEGGQVVAGEIIFTDGKLSFSATKGYEVLMENLMKGKIIVGEKVFDPATDPKAWLRSLPSFYTGSIVRARLGGPFYRAPIRTPFRAYGACKLVTFSGKISFVLLVLMCNRAWNLREEYLCFERKNPKESDVRGPWV